MKRALFFLLLLISFEGFGQVKQKPLSYGVEYSRVQADSAFRIPTVTVGIKNAYAGLDTAQLYYNKTDSGVYVYTGSQWRSVGGSDSTHSWQQTLTAGANRTAAVSSSGSNLYDFTFDSTQFKVKGVYGSGQTIVSFTSSQMFFNPRKGAFRAGFSSGTQWNNSNVGEISFASGSETIASGHTSIAMGVGSVASSTYSVAIGNTNIASGTSSLAMVKESVSSGDASAAIGLGLKSKSYGGFVVGSYNDSTNAADPSDYNSANRIFQVGIGSEDAARANAMTILYSGNVGIGTTSPSQLLHVNGIAQIGTAGSTLGQLNISGNTSGTITIKPQAAAGTYNFNLPTTAGTSGYFLTSGGGGGTAMTWTQNNFLTAIPGIDDVLGMGQKLTMAREIDTDGFDLAVGDVSGTVNRNRWELVDASNKMFYTNTDNTGQFGINTSTPTGALHVKANAGAINALFVDNSSGNVGIGTSTPAKIFHTVGTVRHASLGTASSDTTTYKPLGIDANGDVLPMTYWPGGGGGGGSTSPGGSDTYVQFNDAGSFGGDAGFTYDKTTNVLSTNNGAYRPTGSISFSDAGAGSVYRSSSDGLVLRAVTGSGYDFMLYDAGGNGVFGVETGTSKLGSTSQIGAGLLGYGSWNAWMNLRGGTTTNASLTIRDGVAPSSPAEGQIWRTTDKVYNVIQTGAATKEFTLNDIALTSGRIPYTTTNGRLTDTATFLRSPGGSVSIGTSSPSASALLDVSSTTKGALMPRMTTTQRDAISSPATGLELFNTTTNTKQIYDGTRWVEAAHPLYKVYTALLTQSGTSAPTATVLENTLGGTVVWSYNSAGDYTATLSGAFTSNKTWLMCNAGQTVDTYVGNFVIAELNLIDVNSVRVITSTGGSGADDELLNTSIQIRVYY